MSLWVADVLFIIDGKHILRIWENLLLTITGIVRVSFQFGPELTVWDLLGLPDNRSSALRGHL
jgi:hypothetical protein